ncbi:hypothetical protein [Ammoniphilus sp. YIM 78166]|uniref:hypothetical protein n=1 Tax=Ammoniphilus sp. YIM 78166 TaxID=1644106 RepID=UPI001431A79D|nr:hypothetical protein [Ammoniphilus sp. YIM 78166]
MVIVAEPKRTGYQEIWIERRRLPSGKMLLHLVTSFEIDYLPIMPPEVNNQIEMITKMKKRRTESPLV